MVRCVCEVKVIRTLFEIGPVASITRLRGEMVTVGDSEVGSLAGAAETSEEE